MDRCGAFCEVSRAGAPTGAVTVAVSGSILAGAGAAGGASLAVLALPACSGDATKTHYRSDSCS